MHAQHEAPRPQPRLHQLDGLRAIAAVLVVFYHSTGEPIRQALEARGWPALGTLLGRSPASGVELFFVLSGVVLLRPYLRRERRLDVRTYLARRVERIGPPYLGAWLLAGAVTALMTARPSWFGEQQPRFTWSGWAAQAFVLRFTDVLYNGAWWSLAVEILFYAVAPVVVLAWATSRLRPWHGWSALALAVVAASLLWASVVVEHLPLAMLYSLVAYGSCFCGGVLLARFDLPRWATLVFCVSGAAWVAAALWLPWLNFHVGYGLLYTGVVHHLVTAQPRGTLLSHPLAVWLGERSYSLFLVHVSVFQLVDHVAALVLPRSAAYFAITRLIGIPASFLVAMALFTLVERHFARGLVTAREFWPPLSVRPRLPLPTVSVGRGARA